MEVQKEGVIMETEFAIVFTKEQLVKFRKALAKGRASIKDNSIESELSADILGDFDVLLKSLIEPVFITERIEVKANVYYDLPF